MGIFKKRNDEAISNNEVGAIKENMLNQSDLLNDLKCPICGNNNIKDCYLSGEKEIRDSNPTIYVNKVYINNNEFKCNQKYCTKCGYILPFVSLK